MAAATVPARRAAIAAGDVLDPGSLAERATEVARQQAAPLTRDAHAGVYRAFCQFLGPTAGAYGIKGTRSIG